MTPLVSKTDLDNYKYVADSVRNATSWSQFVSEAQLFDVKNWLGDSLFIELINQAETSPTSFSALNTILLDGGEYIYSTKKFYFQGLKACIIYYAFARFTNRTAFNYTAAGIVLKESDFSNPATTKDVQRLETEARLMAEAIKCEVMTYLNRNSELYPLWKDSAFCSCNCSCQSNRPFTVKGE